MRPEGGTQPGLGGAAGAGTTPPVALEIEAKYDVADPAAADALLHAESLGDAFVLEPGTFRLLYDTYLDTPDQRLRRAGCSLRLRISSGRAVLTVKCRAGEAVAGGAILARIEVEHPLEAPEAWHHSDDWPAAIRDAVRSAVGDAAIHVAPFVLLHQARVSRAVRRAESAAAPPIAILSVEHVLASRVASDAAAGGRPREVAHWITCEAELCGAGTPDDLARIDAVLRARRELSPNPTSKLARALAAEAASTEAAPASRVS